MQPVTMKERRVQEAYQKEHCKYSRQAVNTELVNSICKRCFTTLSSRLATCQNCHPMDKRRSPRLNPPSQDATALKTSPKMDIAYLLN